MVLRWSLYNFHIRRNLTDIFSVSDFHFYIFIQGNRYSIFTDISMLE